MKLNHREPWADHDFVMPLSVSEMATVIGLSRSQFNDHVRRGVFPPPVYDINTRRPFYLPDHQRVVVGVRTSRIGVNGKFVLFYDKRQQVASRVSMSRRKEVPSKAVIPLLDDLMRALADLGMTTVTRADVERAAAEAFPSGVPDDLSKVVQPIFVNLRRQGLR